MRTLLAILASAALSATLPLSCAEDDPPPPPEILSFTLGDNPNSVLSAVVEATLDRPGRVYLEFGEGWTQRTGLTEEGTQHEIVAVGMRAETTVPMRLTAVGAEGQEAHSEPIEYRTGAIPFDVPEYAVTNHDPDAVQPGVLLFSPRRRIEKKEDRPVFYGLDEEGEIVWYYHNENDPFRFRGRIIRQLENGHLMTSTIGGLRTITIGGELVHEIGESQIEGLSPHHDAIRLPNGNYLFISAEERLSPVAWSEELQTISGDLLIETDPYGNRKWSWSAFDHLDTMRSPYGLTGGDDQTDWTHANSLVFDPRDDSLLVCLRHQGWIVKIDRASGEIVWRLGRDGDFALEAGSIWFAAQHAPEIQPDGSIMLYDNGLYRDWIEGDWFSRAVTYAIDEATMTARETWEYRTDYFTPMVGDVDRLANGNVLVTPGGQLTAAQPVQIVEVTGESSPRKVWSLEMRDWILYRAEKIDSFYPNP